MNDAHSAMPTREPFSGPDNAWRRMGTTNNLMTITGVLIFEEPVGYEELCDRLEQRLLRYERFNQRVGGRKRRFMRPYWETFAGFDVRNHIYNVRLPEPGDQAALEQFVGKLMSRPLDERRPMWEAYLIEEGGPGEGNAVAIRINHALGDGFALLYVMLGLVDNPDELEFPIGGVSAPPPEAGHDRTVPPTRAGGANDGVTEKRRKKPSPRGALGAVGMGARAVTTGVDLLTRSPEPNTSLVGELCQTKRAAWTRPIDLGQIKAIGKAHDATVNDVLLATTAGAIRRVLESRGEDTTGVELRCTIPVNLKPMDERTESLGNYFGLVFAPIPVGTRDLNERIERVHAQMDVQKAGIEAFLMYQLLRLGGYVPERVQQLVMKLFEDKATCIVTNVPGPVNAAEIAGKKVSDMIFWVPQANEQGLGISFISYNGSVRVGVAADANLLPDPKALSAAFEAEVDELLNGQS